MKRMLRRKDQPDGCTEKLRWDLEGAGVGLAG